MTMSEKELGRLDVLTKLGEGLIRPKEAAMRMHISTRQLRNLQSNFKRSGPKGLISKKRGKKGNHEHLDDFRKMALELVMKNYLDFGPTLAAEKLFEIHGLKIGVETLRQWMIESGIWILKKSKKHVLHPLRARRKRFGELIQIDGSHHAWFEDRGVFCTLLVFVDDATSEITALQFRKSEDLVGYFQALEQHVNKYGIPLALYSDRFSVFIVSHGVKAGEHKTQFKKALDELGIELICARSPQAKGRVERANGTLQNRLVKELRLRNISTIEEANLFAPEYLMMHNARFKKPPAAKEDAHRPLREGLDLDLVLCKKETRKLTKDLTFQYANVFYKVLGIKETRRAVGKRVEIYDTKKGLFVMLDGNKLKWARCDELIEAVPEMDSKDLVSWEPKNKLPPAKNHPWRGRTRRPAIL